MKMPFLEGKESRHIVQRAPKGIARNRTLLLCQMCLSWQAGLWGSACETIDCDDPLRSFKRDPSVSIVKASRVVVQICIRRAAWALHD